MNTMAGARDHVDLDPIRRAIAGGVAGTIVMAVVMLIGEAQARFELGISDAIARYAGVAELYLLGLLVFFGFGMFVWPLVFLAVQSYLTRLPGGSDPAVRGMAFSVPLWVLYVFLASPFNGDPLFVALHFGFALFAHLLYGYTLGAVYYSLSERS